MKLNDDILRSAATMLRDEKLEALSDENEYSAHIFSDEFEQEMQEFIEKVKRGEIKQKRVSLGWQYHTRNGHGNPEIDMWRGPRRKHYAPKHCGNANTYNRFYPISRFH